MGNGERSARGLVLIITRPPANLPDLSSIFSQTKKKKTNKQTQCHEAQIMSESQAIFLISTFFSANRINPYLTILCFSSYYVGITNNFLRAWDFDVLFSQHG